MLVVCIDESTSLKTLFVVKIFKAKQVEDYDVYWRNLAIDTKIKLIAFTDNICLAWYCARLILTSNTVLHNHNFK